MRLPHWKEITFPLYTIFGTAWIHSATNITDVDANDEIQIYIMGGIKYFNHEISNLPPDWGPLYTLWYGFLAKFQPDPLALYYLSRWIVFSFIAIFFFLYLKRMGFNSIIVLLCSLTLIMNPFFLTINRGPNHFALAILLGLFYLSSFIKEKFLYWSFLNFALLIASYIRPEYYLGFVFLYGINIIITLTHLHVMTWKQKIITLGSFIISTMTICKFHGLPQSYSQKHISKSLIVFLAKNVERYQAPQITFKVMDKIYGHPHNLKEALFNNHREFFEHFFYNTTQYMKILINILLSYQYLLNLNFLIILLMGALLFIILHSHHQIPYERWQHYFLQEIAFPPKEFYALALLTIGPIFISCLIFGPLTQYLIGQLPFILTFIIIGILFTIKKIWKTYFASY